jgi:hypothetical protein
MERIIHSNGERPFWYDTVLEAIYAFFQLLQVGPFLALPDNGLSDLDFQVGKHIFGVEQRVTSILHKLTTLYHQGL